MTDLGGKGRKLGKGLQRVVVKGGQVSPRRLRRSLTHESKEVQKAPGPNVVLAKKRKKNGRSEESPLVATG